MNRRADGDRYKSSGGQEEDENEEGEKGVSFHHSATHDVASSTKSSVKKPDHVTK